MFQCETYIPKYSQSEFAVRRRDHALQDSDVPRRLFTAKNRRTAAFRGQRISHILPAMRWSESLLITPASRHLRSKIPPVVQDFFRLTDSWQERPSRTDLLWFALV